MPKNRQDATTIHMRSVTPVTVRGRGNDAPKVTAFIYLRWLWQCYSVQIQREE